jgi:CheY-like chemotaxis protein
MQNPSGQETRSGANRMQGQRNRGALAGADTIEVVQKPLVRVVDDEPSIQNLFLKMAAIGGFECQPFLMGHELLDRLDETRPGCLVIDLILPDRSGIELLQALSAWRASPRPCAR